MKRNLFKRIEHTSNFDTRKNQREGLSMEEVMRINTANKEIPSAMLPELYQKRSEGIDPLCDIRSDKFQLAQDAMDKVSRAHLLASQNKDKMGKSDNTWITDEDGKPMFDNPHEQTSTE